VDIPREEIHFLYITKPQKEIAAEYNSRQEGVMWADRVLCQYCFYSRKSRCSFGELLSPVLLPKKLQGRWKIQGDQSQGEGPRLSHHS